MRKDRFNPSVTIVSQKTFSESNFLKHYNKTPKSPTLSSVIKSLKQLDDDDTEEFRQLLSLFGQHPEDEYAIRVYSSDQKVAGQACYCYINEQIHEDDDFILSKLMPLIRTATCQINYNPPNKDCTVYRGMKLNDKTRELFKVGLIFRFPGFVSTSKSKEKAMEFGNTLFIIKIYAGCLQVRDICNISAFPKEEEFLFSPYSLFEVIEKNPNEVTLKAHDNKKKIGMDISIPELAKKKH